MILRPSELKGSVRVPPSKSLQHRAIICAALAEGESHVFPVEFSDDITATVNGMQTLGLISCTPCEEGVSLLGGGKPEANPVIDCMESGSTLRFLMPISLVRAGRGAFLGRGKLGERPMDPFARICDAVGARFELVSVHPMRIELEGALQPGVYALPGNVSSQFASGLLFCLPLLEGDSSIQFDAPPESKSYIDLTLDAMRAFGVSAQWDGDARLVIPGGQAYRAGNYEVEADYSQAAVFLCADALGADVALKGLPERSHQGDHAVLDALQCMGAEVMRTSEGLKVCAKHLHGAVIDAADCPDIAPILALTCALAEGESEIINCGRLRIKECDRLAATCEIINRMGGQAREGESSMRIVGVPRFKGGCALSSFGDHRMAMLAGIAALRAEQPVTLDNGACVSKSYPDFWERYRELGGKFDV